MMISIITTMIFLITMMTPSAAGIHIPSLLVQYGEKRTATTLQYQTLCAISILLREPNQPVVCNFKNTHLKLTAPPPGEPVGMRTRYVVKSHHKGELESFVEYGSKLLNDSAWVFTTARNSSVKNKTAIRNLNRNGSFPVKFVQLLSDVAAQGHLYAAGYAEPFGLSADQTEHLVAYLRYWDILRRCCGSQMAHHYRDLLHSGPHTAKWLGEEEAKNNTVEMASFGACAMYKVDVVEHMLIQTKVFQLGQDVRQISAVSDMDGKLTGDYCRMCNEKIAREKLPGFTWACRHLGERQKPQKKHNFGGKEGKKPKKRKRHFKGETSRSLRPSVWR